MNPLNQRSYFFDAGIRFTCRRCGGCCTGAPGIVRVANAEIAAIAAYLGQPVSRVVDAYLTAWKDGYRVKEDDDGRCLFFDDGCRLYPVRPNQCRSFPFWFANLRSEARWNAIQAACPGIGTGHHFAKEEILEILGTGMLEINF